jgi:hypothetical protein
MTWGAWMEFVDCRGFRARTTFYLDYTNMATSALGAHSLFPRIATMSNANYQSGGGLLYGDNLPVQYGSNDVYSSVEDKAVFIFGDASGQCHKMELPAPSSLLFLPDGETLDIDNADVTSFTELAFIYNICGRSGSHWTSLIGGYRTRRRNQRKLSVYIKNPSLTGPG